MPCLILVFDFIEGIDIELRENGRYAKDHADNRVSHLELALDGDEPVYYFQADIKGCLADVKNMGYAPGILMSEENFMQLYRIRSVELGRKTE